VDRRRTAPALVPDGIALELRLSWVEHGGAEALCIGGWPAAALDELRRLSPAELTTRVAVLPAEVARTREESSPLQPAAGRYELDRDRLLFLPRFPFVAGTGYSVVVDGEAFSIERPAAPAQPETAVAEIFPTAAELPANQLKLYVAFSAPMSEGFAARAVSVRAAGSGEQLSGVFAHLEPELWDPRRTRLTLLLDPGRIKRGLVGNTEVGTALREGEALIVEVAESFRDEAGRPLRAPASRRYEVGPAVRQRVDPGAWRLDAPAAGSTGPLVATFDRPLDRALLEHCLTVQDVDGTVAIGAGELTWSLTPATPWRAGRRTLRIDTRLEDLAGNSLVRVFDRDLTRPSDDPGTQTHASLDFESR
jgi:hypothetical protein